MKRTLGITLVVILLLIVTPRLVWQFTSISEVVSEGEGYGFVIGESKISTFQRIIDDAEKNNYKAIQVGDGTGDFRVFNIHGLQITSIEDYDRWVILIDDADSFLNITRLVFLDKNLIKIYRSKKLLELP